MQHRLLLGSTALVSAGLLMSGSALAQEVGGIEVTLGGYTEFGIKAATEDTLKNDSDTRNYLFFQDNEVFVRADGVTDGGINYGSKLEIEVGSGDGNDSDVEIDEAGLYISGNFGRTELGQDDGAANVMGIGAADAQAGTGGIDGDSPNLIQFEAATTGDNNKVTYFTPRVAGFQLGASFTPDNEDGFTDEDGGQENIIEGGINWVGALGPADLVVALVGVRGEDEDNAVPDDNLESWDAGFLAGFGGLSFGVQGGQNTDLAENDFLSAGIKYGFGAANVSAGWVYNDPEDGDDSHLFSVAGDIGLMSGVTLKADVTYNADDPNANCVGSVCDADDTDETIAGVVSLQLDY